MAKDYDKNMTPEERKAAITEAQKDAREAQNAEIEAFMQSYRDLCKKHNMRFVVECDIDYEYDPYDPTTLACIHIVSTNGEMLRESHLVVNVGHEEILQ